MTTIRLHLLPCCRKGRRGRAARKRCFTRHATGLNQYWGHVDGRAADLLEIESDPRTTVELLPDWERAWGLPDPCFPNATSIAERQNMLVLVMTLLGGQSRAFYRVGC